MAKLDDWALCKLYKNGHLKNTRKKKTKNENEENEEVTSCNQKESCEQEQDTTTSPHEPVNTLVLPAAMTDSSRPQTEAYVINNHEPVNTLVLPAAMRDSSRPQTEAYVTNNGASVSHGNNFASAPFSRPSQSKTPPPPVNASGSTMICYSRPAAMRDSSRPQTEAYVTNNGASVSHGNNFASAPFSRPSQSKTPPPPVNASGSTMICYSRPQTKSYWYGNGDNNFASTSLTSLSQTESNYYGDCTSMYASSSFSQNQLLNHEEAPQQPLNGCVPAMNGFDSQNGILSYRLNANLGDPCPPFPITTNQLNTTNFSTMNNSDGSSQRSQMLLISSCPSTHQTLETCNQSNFVDNYDGRLHQMETNWATNLLATVAASNSVRLSGSSNQVSSTTNQSQQNYPWNCPPIESEQFTLDNCFQSTRYN